MTSLPRSIQWRVDLGQLPRLSAGPDNTSAAQTSATSTPASRPLAAQSDRLAQWKQQLDKQRQRYQEEKARLLQAPDDEVPMVGSSPKAGAAGASVDRSQSVLSVNNPLSLADENPWHAHFARLGIIEQIKIDVQRVFAEEERFESAKSRYARQVASAKGTSSPTMLPSAAFDSLLTSVLAVWSLQPQHEDVGYRQGMHELAALCWLVIVEDLDDTSNDIRHALVAQVHLEEDTYSLFEAIMERTKPWYAWRNSSQLPILRHCEVVRDSLDAFDLQLGKHLDRLGIATQLFAIRWIRLLFTRELAMEVAIELWDELFRIDPTFELVNHICVAMLVRIEQQILAGGNSEALRLILSYPKDAVMAGHSVQMLIEEAQQVRRRYQVVQAGSEPAPPGSYIASSSPKLVYDQAGAAASFTAPNLSDLARGIYAQSVGAGFNRALYNVQRTVQQAYQQAQLQRQGSSSGAFPPGIQTADTGANAVRRSETFESPSADNSEDRLHRLIHSNRSMSAALADVVTVLERQHEVLFAAQDGKGSKDTKSEHEAKSSTPQADLLLSLTALKHIRDVLSGQIAEFDAAAVAVKPEPAAAPVDVEESGSGARSDHTRQSSQRRAGSHRTAQSGTSSSGKTPPTPFAARFQLAPESAFERSSQSVLASYGRATPHISSPPSLPSPRTQSDFQSRPVPPDSRKGITDRLREASVKSRDAIIAGEPSHTAPLSSPPSRASAAQPQQRPGRSPEPTDPLGAGLI